MPDPTCLALEPREETPDADFRAQQNSSPENLTLNT